MRPTPAEVPTATLQRAVCPERRDVPPAEWPQDVPSLVETLQEYLDAGGSPTLLPGLLSEAYDPGRRDVLDFEVLVADLTGDQIDEVVIAASLSLLREDGWASSSSGVMLFSCRDGDYEVYSRDASPDMPGYFVHDYTLLPVRGVTAADSHDIVFFEDVGGMFCERQIGVLSQFGTEWGIRWVDLGRCDVEVAVADLDDRAHAEILVLGAEHGSFAWTYRHVLRTYGFRPPLGGFYLRSRENSPPVFRLEELDDARSALERGDYMQAWGHYLEAARSDSLGEYPSWYEAHQGMGDDIVSSYQRAFARFRIVWLWVRLGFHNRAFAELEEMGRLFPPEEAGGEFTVLARSLVEDVSGGATLAEACRRVTSTILQEYPSLAGREGHIGWSSADVADYEAEDICPPR
jgi:hypothetical protein